MRGPGSGREKSRGCWREEGGFAAGAVAGATLASAWHARSRTPDWAFEGAVRRAPAHQTSESAWPFSARGRTLMLVSSPVRKLLDEAQNLSKEDRALLLAGLAELDVSEDDAEAAWDEEIARRMKSIEDGTAVLYTHEEVELRMKQILKR